MSDRTTPVLGRTYAPQGGVGVVRSSCPYFGRPQPSNMRSANERPLCTACAERLTFIGGNTWRHESDLKAKEAVDA